MSATMMPPGPMAPPRSCERRAHLESMLVVVLSIACLVLAFVDLLLLATYSV